MGAALMRNVAKPATSTHDAYGYGRYWFLHCLLLLSVKAGNNVKERKHLQRELVRIRAGKYGT